MAYDLRVFERPVEGEGYAIGGDPAEGLKRGDDSVLQVIRVGTGRQVCEVQGKIDPLAFAELAFALGTWYNHALIGIENNKDGGANRHLFSLGYRNIYFDHVDRGRPYDEATPKLGIFMSAPLKARLVAWVRRIMLSNDLVPLSRELIAQFEIFVLNGISFEAVSGGHDDLVMAWLIAAEMMRVQIMYEEASQNTLEPLVGGRPLNEIERRLCDEEKPKPIEDRITEKILRERREAIHNSTVGSLV